MVEDPGTKDVFREFDGFLIVTSLLSSIERDDNGAGEPQTLIERMESARLAMAITSQAMAYHTRNKEYFEVCPCFIFVCHLFTVP